MSYVSYVSKNGASTKVRSIFEKIETQGGSVTNVLRVLAHSPELLRGFLTLQAALSKTKLDPKLRELAYLKASHLNRCDYCLRHHREAGQKAGLSDRQMQDLDVFERSPAYDELERDVLCYAAEVTRHVEVSDDLMERLGRRLTEREIVELALTVAIANFTNRVTETLEIDLPRQAATDRVRRGSRCNAARGSRAVVVLPEGIAMSSTDAENSWAPLSPRERRVLGVLVEKAKTTPEYYPLTIAALVSGCNQKSNRDPVTNYDADDVEEILHELRKKGAAVMVEAGGRVARWKHTLYEWLKVDKVELAVVAELLLRGAQTEGELRGRASRMEPLADLAALQAILEALARRGLVVYLSPPGQKRGVVVTHGLYPPKEAEQVRLAFARHASEMGDEDRRSPSVDRVEPGSGVTPESAEDLAALRSDIEKLRNTVVQLAADVQELKTALGL